MYIYTSLPIFLHLHSLRIMTSQATSASVAANVVSGAWRRVLLLGEGLATRIFVYVGLEIYSKFWFFYVGLETGSKFWVYVQFHVWEELAAGY